MTEEIDYRKFKIPVDVNKKGRLILDLPKICSICGSVDKGGDYKYKVSYNKYLLIPLCEEHYEILGSKPKPIKVLVIPFLFTLLTFIPSLLISLITQYYWITTIIVIIDVIFFCAYGAKFGLTMVKYNLLESELRNKIRIGYLKDKNIVISSNFTKWIEILLSLNQYDEIGINVSEIEIYKKKLFKWMMILLIYTAINIPILFILSLFFNFILIGYFTIVLGVFIIIMFIAFNLLKIQELKTTPITLGQKICLLILFSFIFLIMTLGWFFQ